MARAPRPFVTTVYRADPDGVFVPEMPSAGVCAQRDDQLCRLGVDHRRERTTGPGFALTVAGCHTHRCRFTLYPPGHVPYGRQALAPCAPDGAPIQASEEEPLEVFRDTLFEAALDAEQGQPWQRQGDGPTHRWWPSQHRQLALASRVLGLDPHLSASHREQVAELLALDLVVLHEQAATLHPNAGYRARGEALVHILQALPASRLLPERLLECAALAGVCGPPHRWLPESATLRRYPFRVVSPPAPACRSP